MTVTIVTKEDLAWRLVHLAREMKMPVDEMFRLYNAGSLRGTIAEVEIHMTLFLVGGLR